MIVMNSLEKLFYVNFASSATFIPFKEKQVDVNIRHASNEDLTKVHELIGELAAYEEAPDEVTLDEATFKKDFQSGHKPYFNILVAESEQTIVGFALYFFTYSTWKGRCLYLEDFYVKANHRRKRIGQALFETILTIAKEEAVKRLAWQVLEWNEPAIEFYKQYNAELDPEWINGRLRENQIEAAKTR